ncbi:MAG: hypothetical protein ACLQVG_16720 [Terriglobia bacterium]
MTVKMNGTFRIDNLRQYSPETVETLRGALLAGSNAIADPRRKNFFDLEAGDRIFYIHVNRTGTVLLLACWRKEPVRQLIPREASLPDAVLNCRWAVEPAKPVQAFAANR